MILTEYLSEVFSAGLYFCLICMCAERCMKNACTEQAQKLTLPGPQVGADKKFCTLQ